MILKKNYFKLFRNEEKVIFFLIILLPVSLTTGPLIPDLIITISSIIFIYKILKDDEFHNFLILNYKKETLLFSVFFIIIILSLLNSSIIKNSFLSSFFYFRFFLFLLVVSFVFYKHPKTIIGLTISIVTILFKKSVFLI